MIYFFISMSMCFFLTCLSFLIFLVSCIVEKPHRVCFRLTLRHDTVLATANAGGNVFLFQLSQQTNRLESLVCLLSFFLSIFLSFFLSFYLSIFLSFYLSFFLSIFLSFFLSFFHYDIHSLGSRASASTSPRSRMRCPSRGVAQVSWQPRIIQVGSD
jgi:hypothetical protein